MWTLEQKQKYLRQKLDKDQFQEFFQFLDQDVGNFNIEQWSDDFLVQLVSKFQKKKQEENQNLQTSFYHYQANQVLTAVASMILGDEIQKIKNQDTNQKAPEKQTKPDMTKKEPEKNVHFKKQPEKKEVAIKVPERKEDFKKEAPKKQIEKKQPEKEQSAIDFLNQIVKKPVQQPKAKQQNIFSLNAQNFKTYSPEVKPEPSAANFATNQFWNIGTTNKTNKNTKSNKDFADFQFFSQPPSSPASSKINNFDNFSEKGFIKKEQKPQPQQNAPNAVSFDQLLASCDKEKGPSPYQKKTNHDEVIVEKDVDKHKRTKSEHAEKKQTKSEKQKSVNKKKKTAKVLYDGQIILKKAFQSTVKCFPSAQRMKLKDPSLKATIEGHEIVKRNFLMPDYTMYSVKIRPLNITIMRNYEDFERLRDTLRRLFPGNKLAYLESNSWFSSTNQDFINSQKVMLEFFLNDLIKNSQIRNSKILEDFLTLPDHKKIKRKFEEWDKLQAPKSIQQLCLIGGRVQINLSEQQRLYQQNFKRYHGKMVDFLEKHQRLSHTLSQQLKEVQKTETKLIQLLQEMMDDTTYFNERVYDLELERINDALKFIHTIHSEETKCTAFRQTRLQSMVEPFIKYQRSNIEQLERLIDLQQDFFKTYLKRSNYEKIDQKIPYTSDKIKAYKSGILEQSKNIIVLKYQAGFLSNQMCFQGYRVMQTLGDKYLTLYKDYAQQCRDNEQKTLEFWSEGIYKKSGLIV